MIIANSALRTSLAIYHLIGNTSSWNNRKMYHWLLSQILADTPLKLNFVRVVKSASRNPYSISIRRKLWKFPNSSSGLTKESTFCY